MIDKSGLKLVSKENGEVSAYHDSSIFFAIKGCSVDKKQEGLPTEPYGIIPSHYENPFTLEFDEDNLTVSIKPGILHVYGRQVELTEAVEVYDFHSTVESQLMYCTIYIEISLEDMTLQIARLKIDIAGAGYKNFDANMTRDNLYKLDHGVFQAPIARFQYAPSATPHFSNGEIVMPTLEGETREAVREINYSGKINDVPCPELWERKNPGSYQGHTNIFKRWLKASNVDALHKYINTQNHDSNSGGYSIAAEGEKFGDTETHETTTINSSLTGIVSVKRKKVTSLGTWFGTDTTNEIKINTDTAHLQAIRIYFSQKSFTAKVNYQRKYLMTGWQWQDQYPSSVTCILNPDAERWITSMDSTHRFCLYYYHWFYVVYQSWHSEEELKFGTYEDFQAAPGTEDNPNWSTGSTSIYSINTKRRFMDVYVTITSGQIKIKFEGRGYSGDFYEFLDGWWRWCPLQSVSECGDMYVDLIYKGDVRS